MDRRDQRTRFLMRRWYGCAGFLWLLCSAAGLCAQQLEPFTMPSARYAALGGRHAAYVQGLDALLTNPAALSGAERAAGFGELSLSMYSYNAELFSLLGRDDGERALSSFDQTAAPALGGMTLGGPVSFGAIGKTLGWGIFNRTWMKGIGPEQDSRVNINADVFGCFGYGIRLFEAGSHALTVGLVTKVFFRYLLNPDPKTLGVTVSTGGAENGMPSAADFGFGFDLGFQYKWADALVIGFAARDALAPSWPHYRAGLDAPSEPQDPVQVHPMIDLGAAYHFPSVPLGTLALMLDYRDMADLFLPMGPRPRNPLLNIAFGAEYILRERLFIRLGMSGALPAGGVGLIGGICRFDLAIRGVELGLEPGERRAWAVDCGILIRR